MSQSVTAAYLRCHPSLLYHRPGALQSVAGLLTTILGNIVRAFGGGNGAPGGGGKDQLPMTAECLGQQICIQGNNVRRCVLFSIIL